MSLFSLDDLIVKTSRSFEPDVIEYAKNELVSKKWKDVAIQMGYKIEKTDYLDLAGAMIVEHMKVYGPTSMEHYTSIMKERLDPKVYAFMLEHKEVLTALMKKYEHRDYAYSFFSAMNLMSLYMAKPSFDEDSFETPCYFYMRVIVGLFYNYNEKDIAPCDALGVPPPVNELNHPLDEHNGKNTVVEAEEKNNVTPNGKNKVEENALKWIEYVYEQVVYQRISFATPTLFSSGFNKSQKASCFLLQVGDNLEEILDAVSKMGQISKYRGGIGIDISQIRHSNIGSVGMSSGTRNLVLLYDRLVRYADQTGIRKGAATVYQRPHHPDILDFIAVVDKDERGKQESAHNIENAIWMNWMFLKRLRGECGGKWTLFCPAKTPSLNHLYGEAFIDEYTRLEALYEKWKGKEDLVKEYINGAKGTYCAKLEERYSVLDDARYYCDSKEEVNNMIDEMNDIEKRMKGCQGEEKESYKFILGLIKFTKQVHVDDVISKITEMQRKWGKPYILNGDAGNYKSNQKNLGYIRCSNLCTEIFEFTSKDEIACCNLGSLVLGNYYDSKNNRMDFDKLGNNARMMTNLLNRVIDDNFYPVAEAKNSNMLHRPIGLGVCGWGDILNKLRLNVDSEEGMFLNKQIAACICFNTHAASSYLASVFGSYLSFEGSPISEGKFQFDLWQDEYKELDRLGLLNKKVRKWESQLPISPSEWGQRPILLNRKDRNIGEDKVLEPTWDDLRIECFLGMRNSLLIARMPTASSASISYSTESAEIHSANLYTKDVLAISAPIVNYHMVKDLRELKLWNTSVIDFIRCCDGSIGKLHLFIQEFPEKVPHFDIKDLDKLNKLQKLYRTVWEISQKVFIQQSAEAGIYICQGHSFNLWLPDPTSKQLKMAMLMSFDMGIKTLNYYVRRLSAVKPNAATIEPSISAFGSKMRSELFFGKKVSKPVSSGVVVKEKEEEPVEVCKMEEGCLFCAS